MTNEEYETKQWIERAAPGATVQVGTERIVVDPVTGKLTTEPVKHWSDCAVHSEPAYPAGPCDCHLSIASRLDELMTHAYQGSTEAADEIAKELIEIYKALQPAYQEPVAMRYDFDGYGYQYIDNGSGSDWMTRIKNAEPLYSASLGRQWQNLTIEEINEVLGSDIHDEPSGALEFVRAIEAKLRGKNA